MLAQRVQSIREIVDHPRNRGRKFNAVVRYLKWNVGRRLMSDAEYLIEVAPGCSVLLSNRENYATLAYCCGLYDHEEMSFMLALFRPGDVFGDFGSNVGVYSAIAAKAGASVIAVEPVPDTFARLERNFALNGITGRAVNCGLGAAEQKLRFTTELGGLNRVAAKGEPHTCEIPVRRADDLCGELDVAPLLVKVDVEGWELPLFEGARRLLSEHVVAVIVEMNGSGRRFGFSDQDVDTLLRECGFATHRYDPESRRLTTAGSADRVGFNSLYLKVSALEFITSRLAQRQSGGGLQVVPTGRSMPA